MQCWFFGANGTLGRARPVGAGGADRYAVDFRATSGSRSRWHTQSGPDVVYPDRSREGRKLLAYTSAPQARASRSPGTVVTLDVAPTPSRWSPDVWPSFASRC